MLGKGFDILSGGTDNHYFIVDMRSKGTDGGRIEALLSELNLSINKNTVPGDKSALIPSGIKIGSPAMTTRGCKEEDFVKIMEFIERATAIATELNRKSKGTKLNDFKEVLKGELESPDLVSLRKDISAFAARFPVPGGLL